MLNLNRNKLFIILIPVLSSLIMSIVIVLLSKYLPPKLPLFYSLPWGDKQLGSVQQLFILPAIILLVTLLNLIISWQLHPQQIYFKNTLFFSSLLVTTILVITFFRIIFIFI